MKIYGNYIYIIKYYQFDKKCSLGTRIPGYTIISTSGCEYHATLQPSMTCSTNLFFPAIDLQLPQHSMPRNIVYRSPAKIKRNRERLLSHLFKRIKSLTSTKTPNLAITPVSFINYPEPCSICKQQECTSDINHQLMFSLPALVSAIGPKLDERINRMWKPPE